MSLQVTGTGIQIEFILVPARPVNHGTELYHHSFQEPLKKPGLHADKCFWPVDRDHLQFADNDLYKS